MHSSTRTFSSALAAGTTISAHVDNNITIAGTASTGSQPYQDAYTSPLPEQIVGPVRGDGPIEDLTWIDLQFGGYAAGGICISSPANPTGPVAAGSDVSLSWTLWPDSESGNVITYMAKCANDDCTTDSPGADYVLFSLHVKSYHVIMLFLGRWIRFGLLPM